MNYRSFICPGCNLLIPSLDGRLRKYCSKPECQRKRKASNDSNRPEAKKARRIYTYKARVEYLSRNTKMSFSQYMKQNPFYFDEAFPKKTIEEAWKEIKKEMTTDL